MSADPYKYFRVEGRELLEHLGKGVLDLEKGVSADLVARLLRLAHTLKGAARVVKQPGIADQAHAIEGILSPFRAATSPLPRSQIDAILGCLDIAGAQLTALALAETAEIQPLGTDGLKTEELFQTVRTDMVELDALLEGIAETHVRLGALRKHVSAMDQTRRLVNRLSEQIAVPHTKDFLNRDAEIVQANTQPLVEELKVHFASLEHNIVSGVDLIDRELRQARDSAERLRLVPVGSLFTSLERTARDTAQTLGRKVVFEGRGGEIRLDAHMLNVIQSALLQIIRNAVAHGIESESDRKAAGKMPEGQVLIEVTRRGRRVLFTCSDDGRGVDLEAVRQVLQRQGALPAEIKQLNTDELLHRLLKGGVSTAGVITEVSGRGIGLDVVRETAVQLGGEATAQTTAGIGTRVELVVPMSLASVEALVVETGSSAVAIPLEAVRQILRVRPDEIAHSPNGDSIIHNGKSAPFAFLSRLLVIPTKFGRNSGPWSAVVVAGDQGMAVIGVERLLGIANVVLRPLPALSPAHAVVAGASLDADGTPQLVLDPDALIAAAGRSTAAAEQWAPLRKPILVIDDSLTTRMLEQSILESAGYDVDVAMSGEEALEKAHRKQYALFLCDVEMPGMDGFTFIEKTRADPGLRSVPAILVTSRASRADRERGELAGARAYIVKSEFEQKDLLKRIHNLVD
ncbi:MAG TPA: response regulator [Patescibacteria group bacterium]|nr:response regulator [Patescibacteria group bacterium]